MGKDEDSAPSQLELVYRNPAWDRYRLTDECEAFLREAGTPAELALREERLIFEFAEVLRTVPPDTLTEEQRFFIKETMGIMRGHLTKLREQAEWASAMLSREGYRFDRERNRLERIEGLSPIRRRRFSQEVIALYESAASGGNTRRVRARISEELRGAYPPEMLSPRAYFPIWQCIEEYRKRAAG